MEPKWIELQNLTDDRGALVVAEANKNIPFEIKRVYCLYQMTGDARGFHAHKDLQQVMVCLSGSCIVKLDDGKSSADIKIEASSDGLNIEPMVWHEMSDFSSDCVLMVLASNYYDEEDYMRDYSEFIKECKA